MGVILLELLTTSPAVSPGQQPPNLYARLRRRLPFDAPDVACPAAGFGPAAACGLAGIAAGCIRSVGNRRPLMSEVRFKCLSHDYSIHFAAVTVLALLNTA